MGQDRTTIARKREQSGDDISVPAKRSISEEQAIRVYDLKGQLRKFSIRSFTVCYVGRNACWWGHNRLDEPPATPMVGAARARGTSATNMTSIYCSSWINCWCTVTMANQFWCDWFFHQSSEFQGQIHTAIEGASWLRGIGALTGGIWGAQVCCGQSHVKA